MGRKGKASTWASWRLQENLLQYTFYYQYLQRLVQNMFVWEGLPPNLPSNFIEKVLMEDGVGIFIITNGGFVDFTRCSCMGINNHEEPTLFRPITVSDSVGRMDALFKRMIGSKPLDRTQCVPVWNNCQHKGDYDVINFHAKKLSKLEKTIDSQLNQLHRPYIITGAEGQQLTIENILKNYENGVPFIGVDKDFRDNVSMEVFPLSIHPYIKELEEEITTVLGKFLSYYGINNIANEKKERLVTAEADGNNEQLSILKCDRYLQRLQACECINKMFKCNATVKISEHFMNELRVIRGGNSNVGSDNNN